jgi:release factor glutamine methyltransferase
MKLPRLHDRWAGYGRNRAILPPSSSEEGVGGGGAATGGAQAGTVAAALRQATHSLAAASDTPRLDAEVLMAHALGISRSDLLLRHTRESAPDSFAALVERRTRHEPVAYITGQQEFFGLPFTVTPDVLIPRGDSEVLVEQALAARPDAQRVLDCGTGSGALLLAVLAGLPQAEGIGIDISAAALKVAQGNAGRLGIDSARFLERNWHEAGWAKDLGHFDLILANPPYVEADADLAPSVRNHEPAQALFAGPEGLDDYRVLIPQLPDLLSPDGIAFVEIGANQAGAVTAIATASGLTAALHKDLGGRPRVLELAVGR